MASKNKEPKKASSSSLKKDKLTNDPHETSLVRPDNPEKPSTRIKWNIKNISIAVLGVVLFIYLYQAFWANPAANRGIYLSSQPVDTDQTELLEKKQSIFALGSPIYIHFSMGSSLNFARIRIQIVNVVSNVEHLIGEVVRTVKPEWKHVKTSFQKEFFEERGKYKIKIFSPNNELLSERSFEIK